LIIRARAPLRISFAGGGTDVPPYSDEKGGAVLSATINRYAFSTIETFEGDTFNIKSLDYDLTISFNLTDPIVFDGQLDLAKGVVQHFRKKNNFGCGLNIYLHNDAPPGSGLGSSSALTVSLVQAFCEFFREPLDPYDIAEVAFKIERKEVGIKGGKQDQFASAFGGFNFIEFKRDLTIVNPLRIKPELINELEYSLIFAYVGGAHFSGRIIEKQSENYMKGVKETTEALDSLKALAYQSKDALLLGRLKLFGELLDYAWQQKKRLTSEISTPFIDEIYEAAKKAGALGGKITGAGGGGFMFFFCDPRKRFSVQEVLSKMGAEIAHFSFTERGACAWTLEK